MSTIATNAHAHRKTPLWKAIIRHRVLLLMLLPGIAFFILFRYVPMYGVQIAFRDFKFNKGILGSEWVGLANFTDLFGRASFWEVFRNTVIISFYKLIFGFPAPVIFALLLNEVRMQRFKKITQTISYLPHFVSWAILGALFTQLLSPTGGPVNIALQAFGIKPIYFLGDNQWFRGTLVVTSIWKGVGWGSVVYLAAIAGINTELYEAGTLDGAGRFRLVWNITIPSILPTVMIMFIFAVGSLVGDDFDQIFNMYNAAVYKTGDVLGTYIYRNGMESMNYSFATAAGLFTNIISLVLVVGTNAIAKRFGEYGIW